MSVIVCVFIVQNIHVITLSACVLNLGKLSDVSGLTTVLVSADGGGTATVLLMSQLLRDVAELEEVSFWKSENVLPPSVLLACKPVDWIVCVLPTVWDS